LNGPAPNTFDEGLSKGSVFSFYKCLNSALCNWILNLAKSRRTEDKRLPRYSKSLQQQVDPCSKYPTCQICVKALDYCGWCSVNVYYNATIEGKQCAGLNLSTSPGFLCSGTFSTVNCPTPPSPDTKAPSRPPPTPLPSLKPSAPNVKPPPTNPVELYICNPNNQTCTPGNGQGSMPLAQCNLTCNAIPDVPIVLRGRKFRGLEINGGYLPGEWTCKFTTTSATIMDPKGVTLTAIVSQTGQYLILNLDNGQKIFTLWQVGEGSVVDYLSWAWGGSDGLPPKSFDATMASPGQHSYVFEACSSLSQVCNFGN